jgi:hypothetical protein
VLAADAAAADQAGLLEGGQVLRHGLARDRQLGGQCRRGGVAVGGDALEDRAAGGVGQGREDGPGVVHR